MVVVDSGDAVVGAGVVSVGGVGVGVEVGVGVGDGAVVGVVVG